MIYIRPDKVKHLDYILDAIASDANRIGFLDKLHLYTELPLPNYEENSISVFGRGASWMSRIRLIPLYRIPRVFLGNCVGLCGGGKARLAERGNVNE